MLNNYSCDLTYPINKSIRLSWQSTVVIFIDINIFNFFLLHLIFCNLFILMNDVFGFLWLFLLSKLCWCCMSKLNNHFVFNILIQFCWCYMCCCCIIILVFSSSLFVTLLLYYYFFHNIRNRPFIILTLHSQSLIMYWSGEFPAFVGIYDSLLLLCWYFLTRIIVIFKWVP